MTNQIQNQTTRSVPVALPISSPSAVIVVPCYNEAKRLNTTAFQQFVAQNDSVSFLFVDDGSVDDTPRLLTRMCETNPDRLFAMSLSQNAGKAEAVRQGLLHASTMGAGLIGYWDADLATPLDAIEDFLRIAQKYKTVSVIFGSRRPLLGHRINRTFGRRLVSRLCSTLAYQALRLPISDTQCGAKVFRNSATLRTSLKDPFSAGWLFDVELFLRLSQRLPQAQDAFYELPLSEWTEVAGSKVSAKAILKAGFNMLGLIAQSRFGFRVAPTHPNKVPPVRLISPLPKASPNLAA